MYGFIESLITGPHWFPGTTGWSWLRKHPSATEETNGISLYMYTWVISIVRWHLYLGNIPTSARVKSYQLVKVVSGGRFACKKFNFGITTTLSDWIISLFWSRVLGKSSIFVSMFVLRPFLALIAAITVIILYYIHFCT